MNKNSFGATIRTILTVLLCIVLAVVIWLLVEYCSYEPSSELSGFLPSHAILQVLK